MKFTINRLYQEHDKAIKRWYGENCLKDKNFAINYGWGTTDNSISSKIYRKSGHQVIDTWYDEEDKKFKSLQADY